MLIGLIGGYGKIRAKGEGRRDGEDESRDGSVAFE